MLTGCKLWGIYKHCKFVNAVVRDPVFVTHMTKWFMWKVTILCIQWRLFSTKLSPLSNTFAVTFLTSKHRHTHIDTHNICVYVCVWMSVVCLYVYEDSVYASMRLGPKKWHPVVALTPICIWNVFYFQNQTFQFFKYKFIKKLKLVNTLLIKWVLVFWGDFFD